MATEVSGAPDVVEGPELDIVLRPRGDLVTVDVDGDAVIYDERDEQVHLLNPTAALVWGLLDGESTLSQLCDEVADAYGADVEQVRRDIHHLAGEFERRALLENQHEATGAEPGASDINAGSNPTGGRPHDLDRRESR